MSVKKIPKLGLKVGDRDDDVVVQIVQDFLRQFGYIYSDDQKLGRKIDKAKAAEDVQPKVFDSNTEKALILYQEFHQLPKTGELDKATLNQMMPSLCGVPVAIGGAIVIVTSTTTGGRRIQHLQEAQQLETLLDKGKSTKGDVKL
jgi:Putative peptidoglycan binding domain